MRRDYQIVASVLAILLLSSGNVSAANCGDRKAIAEKKHALAVRIREMTIQSGGVDTPEICHVTKHDEDLQLQLKAIVFNSSNHCGLSEDKIQRLQPDYFDKARAV